MQLSIALQGIVTQQLLPTADGAGRVGACEVLVPTPAIRNLIREGKTHQIYSAIQTSGATGMQTMDAHLAQLVRQGKITRALAEQRAAVPEELKRLLGAPQPRGAGQPVRRTVALRRRRDGAMSTFAFRAVDLAGIPSRGEIEASSKAQVTEQLRQRGLIVLDVSEKREAMKLEGSSSASRGSSMRELAVFSRQFATLIASGHADAAVPLHARGPDRGRDDQGGGRRRSAQDVEAGSSVAQAMERHPKVFDPLYRSMVRAGEGSGRLEEALDRVAFQLEKLDALRRQIRSAMMYPAFVFALAIVVMLVVVAFIVPVFAGIFEEIAAENPGESAELPVHDPDHGRRVGLVTGAGTSSSPILAGSRLGFIRWKKTERGRRAVGPVQAQAPVQDRRRRPEGRARALVADLLRHGRLRRPDPAVDQDHRPDVGQHGDRGGDGGRLRLGQARRHDRRADRRATRSSRRWSRHMVSVGEETGQLEHMLSKIADFYEAEVDAKVKALTSLIEPLMIMLRRRRRRASS